MIKNEITATSCHPRLTRLCPFPPGSYHLWDERRSQWCALCQKNIHFVKSDEEFADLQQQAIKTSERVCIAYEETDVFIIGEIALPYDPDATYYTSRLAETDSPEIPPKFNTPAPEPLETTCRNNRCPHLWNALLPSKDSRYNGRCPQCKKSVRFTHNPKDLKSPNKRTVTTLKPK